MLVVGLTGGIASGKSTVSNYLRQLGAVIIDADQLARKVVEPGKNAWLRIKEHFGLEVINEDGSLDRKKIGEIVFANPLEREILNKIIHPEVIKETKRLIDHYKEQADIKLIVVDAPLLLETGMDKLVDEVWVINIEPELQIRRVIKRDNLTREGAINRLKSQMPTQEKLKFAHRVIDNNNSLAQTFDQLEKAFNEVTNGKNFTSD